MRPEQRVLARVTFALAFLALWHATSMWRALADFGLLVLVAVVFEVLRRDT